MGDFAERMRLLQTNIGPNISGSVTVDQVYAHYQDDGVGPAGKPATEFAHPEGGRSGYLSENLHEHADQYMQQWADDVLTDEPLFRSVIRSAEDLSTLVFADAPRQFWPLRQSAHPMVKSGEGIVYDRPPIVPRLTQDELDALRATLGNGLTDEGASEYGVSGPRSGMLADIMRRRGASS